MKKALSLLLACLLALAFALPASALALGDLDGNGRVSARDARFALRLSAKLEKATAAQREAADADADGNITAKDARIILRVSAYLTTFEEARKPKPDPKKLYAPVLNMFRLAAKNNWKGYDTDDQAGPYPVTFWWAHFEPYRADEIGYAFRDLDGDGTPELLVAPYGKTGKATQVWDLYTIVGGKIVNLFSSGFNSCISLRPDNTLYYTGKTGMTDTMSAVLRLRNGKIVTLKTYRMIYDIDTRTEWHGVSEYPFEVSRSKYNQSYINDDLSKYDDLPRSQWNQDGGLYQYQEYNLTKLG